MSRTKIHHTPQFFLGLIGSGLIIVGVVAGLASSETAPADSSTTPDAATGGLQVRPARQQPGATQDRLQNAGGLQGQQGGTSLQKPTQSDQLQPNAQTDQLPSSDF